MRPLAVLFIGLWCLLPPAGLSADFFTFSDDTFNPANWSQSLADTTALGTTGNFTQVLSGGNPGAYGRVDFHTPAAGDFNQVTLYTAQTYTPATQGAISSFTISADLKALVGGASVFLMFKQGNAPYAFETYFSPGGLIDVQAQSWINASVTGTPDSPLLAGANLVDGPTMEFGIDVEYYTTGPQAAKAFGIDNFSVSITPVPEANTLKLTCLGLGLFAFRRRNGFLRRCR